MTEDAVAQAESNAALAHEMYAGVLDDIAHRLTQAAERLRNGGYPHEDTNYGPVWDYSKHARGVVADLMALPGSFGVETLLAFASEATHRSETVIEARRRKAWREAENCDDK